ncbi:MAG: S1 RNA-binding domain-containing protein [Bdellovibrionota bacterium]
MFSLEQIQNDLPRFDSGELSRLWKIFEEGRPLHSTLLAASELGLKSHPDEIREFYDTCARGAHIEKMREKIESESSEVLEASPALKKALDSARDSDTLSLIEKKLKRRHRSRAALARQYGLETLLDGMWKKLHGQASETTEASLDAAVRSEVEDLNDKSKIAKLLGALLAEKLLDDSVLGENLRQYFLAKADVVVTKNEKAAEDSRFKSFFNFRGPFAQLMRRDQAHRFLNLRRGVSQGDLNMSVEGPRADLEMKLFEAAAPIAHRSSAPSEWVDWALATVTEALEQSLLTQFQKDAFNMLRDSAESEILPPIRRNLRRVLMSPGLGRQIVMGVSPSGKKTCRIAVVDREGHFKETALLHLLEGEKKAETEAVFLALIEKHGVQAIALSDHPGAREIERFLHDLFRTVKIRIPVSLMPSESSDDYASSKIGQEEFPEMETPNRKAVFVARLLQNPLGELVKVKPKSLGVGQFLSEIHPESLSRTLDEVLADCIHEVGVDLNSASKPLLARVAGLNEDLATKIIAYRADKGFFWDRDQILEVAGVEAHHFEYAGPFLRIRDGKNPSDLSDVHPKHNKAILEALKRQKIEKSDWSAKAELLLQDEKLKTQLGEQLLGRIVQTMKNPPKDPRGDFKFIQFREDVKDIRDLKMGMVCAGRVSNVTSFGAFVDIGLQQDGLVHLSELSSTFVRDPFDVIHPGDLVTVKVISVDPDKKQISFTMKNFAEVSEKNQEIVRRHKEVVDRDREDSAARSRAERPRNEQQQQRPERNAAGPRPDRPARPQHGNGPSAGPRRPRPDGPRQNAGPHSGGNDRRPPRDGGGGSNGGARPQKTEGLRDNPFAALAQLRDQLKR